MALLREHGPLSTTEWAQLLVSQGHGFLGEMTEVVEYLEHPLLGTLPDRRHIALDTVLDGRVLTHRLTEAEIASGIVDAKPDLVPLTVLVSAEGGYGAREFTTIFRGLDDEIFSARGVENPDWPEDEALLLEPGVLDGRTAGDVVGLHAQGGTLRLRPVELPLASAPDLAGPLARVVPEDAVEDLDTVLWQLMLDDSSLFAEPTVPLGELIAAAGFACSGDSIAAADFDFEAERARTRVAMVARIYQLDPDSARAVIAFAELVRSVVGQGEADARAAADAVISAQPETYVALVGPEAARAALGEG